MKKIPIICFLIMGLWIAGGSVAQEGILRGPTPPLGISPERPLPNVPPKPAAPAPPYVQPSPKTGPEKGIINPRTGEFYPGVSGGVLNPQTGEVLPKIEGGYINPKTGEFFPTQK